MEDVPNTVFFMKHAAHISASNQQQTIGKISGVCLGALLVLTLGACGGRQDIERPSDGRSEYVYLSDGDGGRQDFGKRGRILHPGSVSHYVVRGAVPSGKYCIQRPGSSGSIECRVVSGEEIREYEKQDLEITSLDWASYATYLTRWSTFGTEWMPSYFGDTAASGDYVCTGYDGLAIREDRGFSILMTGDRTEGPADLVEGSFRREGGTFRETIKVGGDGRYMRLDATNTSVPNADGAVWSRIESGSRAFLCFDHYRVAPQESEGAPAYFWKCAHGLNLNDMSYIRTTSTEGGEGPRRNVRVRIGQCVKQEQAVS